MYAFQQLKIGEVAGLPHPHLAQYHHKITPSHHHAAIPKQHASPTRLLATLYSSLPFILKKLLLLLSSFFLVFIRIEEREEYKVASSLVGEVCYFGKAISL